jgi:hypothetical protein
VRFRLKSLGLSVKVKDGWSFRALQEMLHVGPSKLRRFIADGLLRVRDPRITAESLSDLLERQTTSALNITEPQRGADAAHKSNGKCPKAYSWGSAAKALGTDSDHVRAWIVNGELKIVDGFVTERAFQEFCQKHGAELNGSLLGREVWNWLVQGYSLRVPSQSNSEPIPGNQKHALITRRCPECKRPIRGNVFFRHVRNCKRPTSKADGIAVGSELNPDRLPC